MSGGGRKLQSEDIARDEYVRLNLLAEPKVGYTLADVADHIAGLWSSDMTDDKRYRSHVVLDAGYKTIELAIPLALLRPELGITQLLSILAVPAEYEYCNRLLFERIQFPPIALKAYKGPRVGVDGIRLAFGAPEGPLLGAILKPRLIHDLDAVLASVADLASAGLDFLVDDELMIDSDEAPFEVRVDKVSQLLLKNPSRDGKATAFVANVTARPSDALSFATRAKELGARGLASNPIVTGFGALEDLADANLGLPIFASNMGAALLAKGAEGGFSAGLSESVVCKLTRLAGADAVHAGIEASDWYALVPTEGAKGALSGGLEPIQRAFRVVAGGLTIVSMLDNWPLDDEPVVFEGGSSIFRHPRGAGAGARAFRKTWEVGMKHIGDDPDSRNDAKAALFSLALKDADIKQALTACDWRPADAIIERSRKMGKTGKTGKKGKKGLLQKLRGE